MSDGASGHDGGDDDDDDADEYYDDEGLPRPRDPSHLISLDTIAPWHQVNP